VWLRSDAAGFRDLYLLAVSTTDTLLCRSRLIGGPWAPAISRRKPGLLIVGTISNRLICATSSAFKERRASAALVSIAIAAYQLGDPARAR
jgi:hypothetical protein